MSASISPTDQPARDSAMARLVETVDLPTPPLPEATAMTCLTPAMGFFTKARREVRFRRPTSPVQDPSAAQPSEAMSALQLHGCRS